MSTEYIDQLLVFSAPVQLSVRIESYHLRHDGPGAQMPVVYTLSFRLGERELSRMDYPHGPARVLLDTSVLDDPVRIAMRAQKSPGRERGLLRIVLAAAPTTDIQEAIIMDADHSLPDGMALWDLPEGRVGLSLGDRWLSAGPDVLTPIPIGEDMGARLLEFEGSCKDFFDRILYGDPCEEINRLLSSVGSQPASDEQ